MTVWALATCGFALACAVSVPPSGGPEDTRAPRVASTIPVPDSAGVSPDGPIQITYDEGMTRDAFSRSVVFSPPVEIDRVRWKGNTVFIKPYGDLHPDTTYIVRIREGIRDAHGVVTKKPFEFAFATSATIDTAQVRGRVRFRRDPSANAVVHAYVLPKDSGFTVQASPPDRRAEGDEDGNYVIRYLPENGNALLVWAYQDVNRSGTFDPDGDVGMLYRDTLRLTADAPVGSGIDFDIVDPAEPAIVRGRVINESGIDTMLVVGLFAESDTLPARYYAFCDTTGAFEFRTVLRGAYRMKAFIDLLPDSLCGVYPCGADSTQRCAEPCAALPDSVRVEPGDTRNLDDVRLPPVEAE